MSTASDNPAPQQKGVWDSVITLTPVVMTVVATLLAGLSSSEMTQSMYHRSVAGQNQSKVGDQWGFFQAKRIRGNELELTADTFRANYPTVRITHDLFKKTALKLQNVLHNIDNNLTNLNAAMLPVPLREVVEQFPRSSPKADGDQHKSLVQRLDDTDVVEAFQYLGTSKLPPVVIARAGDLDTESAAYAGVKLDKNAGPLSKAVAAVIDGQDGLDQLCLTVPAEKLHDAVQMAETNARALDKASKKTDEALRDVDRLVDQDVAQARELQRWVRDVKLASSDPAVGDSAAVKKMVDGLERQVAVARAAADDLNNDYKPARFDYTARRNREEANYNRATANVFEVQVHRSSGESDRHRKASQFFFLGMLLAQGGVTISSLALAARKKSGLWLLAAFLGVAAILFSAWVWWTTWIG